MSATREPPQVRMQHEHAGRLRDRENEDEVEEELERRYALLIVHTGIVPSLPAMTSVAILGPGGVGGFVAGAFERADIPVTVVAREETADLIAREGIRVE